MPQSLFLGWSVVPLFPLLLLLFHLLINDFFVVGGGGGLGSFINPFYAKKGSPFNPRFLRKPDSHSLVLLGFLAPFFSRSSSFLFTYSRMFEYCFVGLL